MNTETILDVFLEKAGNIPGVRINRSKYLMQTFGKEYGNKLEIIIREGPVGAGISPKEISRIADQAIWAESRQTMLKSAGTGVFGGPAVLAAVPADIMQFYGHVIRIIQKMMYLYGWPEDIFDSDGNIDDTTMNMLVLYMGLAFGVSTASSLAAQIIAKTAGKKLLKDVPIHVIKAFFTKQAFRKVITKIIKTVGLKTVAKYTMTLPSKTVPLIGALVSGSLTAVFFIPMSMRLKKYFEREDINYSAANEPDSM